jgi:superfamily II DNA/RNA helicase
LRVSEASFTDLGVSAPVVAALAARDVHAPFAVQSLVIADALAGADVLAKSPTGSGKTLAFAIPLVERLDPAGPAPAALVLVPTRELAVQVTEEFATIGPSRGIRVAAVYGGVGMRAQAKAAAAAHVIVATPGRLIDLAQQRAISLDRIRVLVLDEADRMLDMGFKPQVDRIVRRLADDRQTMFFSATLDGEVGLLARRYTRNPARFEVETPTIAVEQVDHRFVPVTEASKLDTLVDLLGEADTALVFVRTKRGAARLAEKLVRRHVPAVAMHGDMTQQAREQALARFEQGKVRTLVATDVAARGIDLEHITHVVNYDPPEDNKAYLHRVGRTGRAGRTGTGVTLVTREQQADVSRIAARLELRSEFEKEGMKTAPPRLVYSSRGRGRGGRRRF